VRGKTAEESEEGGALRALLQDAVQAKIEHAKDNKGSHTDQQLSAAKQRLRHAGW